MYIQPKKIDVGTSPTIEFYVFAEFKLCFKPSLAMWVEIQPGFTFKQTNIQLTRQVACNPVQLYGSKADVHKPAVVKPAINDCYGGVRFCYPIKFINSCSLLVFWNMV